MSNLLNLNKIIFLGFLLAFSSLAEEVVLEEIPDYMKDGTITVTLKDGRVYKFSTNTHKVVKRGTGLKKQEKQDPIKNKNEDHEHSLTPAPEKHTEVKYSSLKNRFKLLGGYGYDGTLKVFRDTNFVEVSPEKGFLMGASYDRLLTNRISAGVVVISNETFLFGIGFDY